MKIQYFLVSLKKWNLSKDLNPIINEEFPLNNNENNKGQNNIDKNDKENF